MKKLWFILMTLGLVAAFCAQASALDVKFSGSFYAAGMYQDKTTLNKNTWISGQGTSSDPYVYHTPGPGTAFYYQRLRVRTEFIVSPGLKLVTRFDAMERAWGAARSSVTEPMIDSAGTRAENENIAFDLAYLRYESPLGDFNIGFMQKGGWGTDFGNNLVYRGALLWGKYFPKTGLYVWGEVAQLNDNSYSATNVTTYSDRDNVEYMAGINYYGIKNVEIGIMYDYSRFASGRNYYEAYKAYGFDYGYVTAAHLIEPYVKARFGPVSIESEIHYAFGDWIKFDGVHTGYSDMSISDFQAYIKARADFGPAYVGGIFAYCAGDDPGTADRLEGGYVNAGREFNPTLIMFNSERTDWAGAIPGYNTGVSPVNPQYYAYSYIDGIMQNAWFFQIFGGVKPIDNLDIMASLSYANADKKPTSVWLYNDYGYELDLTATYKITKNLTYMIGGGYLFTGKFFKGTGENNEVNDNYLVLNKLTLTF